MLLCNLFIIILLLGNASYTEHHYKLSENAVLMMYHETNLCHSCAHQGGPIWGFLLYSKFIKRCQIQLSRKRNLYFGSERSDQYTTILPFQSLKVNNSIMHIGLFQLLNSVFPIRMDPGFFVDPDRSVFCLMLYSQTKGVKRGYLQFISH